MAPALVAATYFAIAKMDAGFRKTAATDPYASFSFDFDMDVNLRKRLETSLGNDHVGTIIGMMNFSLSLSGKTRFWDFVVEVKAAMATFLSKNLHLLYFDVNERFDAMCNDLAAFVENLKRNQGFVQDMNFSSFGKYFFDTTYGNLSIDKMYCTGAGSACV